MDFIIKWKGKSYKQFNHRSGVEEAIKKEWGSQGLSDEQIDKAKFLEKQAQSEKTNVRQESVDKV